MSFNNIWINIDLITENTKAFVYLITLEKDGEEKYYIGYKSIIKGWESYISSSTGYVIPDKEFITRKIILEAFDDKQKAHRRESFLIKKFNAVKSDKFYNRNDSGEKFNVTGHIKNEKQIATSKSNAIKLNNDPTYYYKKKNIGLSVMNILKHDPVFQFKRNTAATKTINVLHQNPDFKEKIRNIAINTIKKNNLDPTFCDKRDAAAKENMIKLNQDPDFCARSITARRKVLSKKVINTQTYVIYSSAAEAEKLTGTSHKLISSHCLGKVKKQKWKFVD